MERLTKFNPILPELPREGSLILLPVTERRQPYPVQLLRSRLLLEGCAAGIAIAVFLGGGLPGRVEANGATHPTETVTPTATATRTATVTPTASITATPTATVTSTSTPDAEATQTAKDLADLQQELADLRARRDREAARNRAEQQAADLRAEIEDEREIARLEQERNRLENSNRSKEEIARLRKEISAALGTPTETKTPTSTTTTTPTSTQTPIPTLTSTPTQTSTLGPDQKDIQRKAGIAQPTSTTTQVPEKPGGGQPENKPGGGQGSVPWNWIIVGAAGAAGLAELLNKKFRNTWNPWPF